MRLYDLSDSRRLACDLVATGADGAQGTVRARSQGGETFQGEWTRLAWQKAQAAGGDSKYPNTLPVLSAQASPLEATWGWAAELGVDFDRFPDSYWSFFMYGDAGTRISGFFLDRTAGRDGSVATRVKKLLGRDSAPGQAHLLGAAKDNLGRRYKLIGQSTEATMEITGTRPASRPAAPAATGTAGKAGTGRTAKGKDTVQPSGVATPAFQEQLDTQIEGPAQAASTAGQEGTVPADPASGRKRAQAAVEAQASAEGVSSAKVFAYGALGVDAPEGETEDQKGQYQAGQWTGAAVKIGGIIALLA